MSGFDVSPADARSAEWLDAFQARGWVGFQRDGAAEAWASAAAAAARALIAEPETARRCGGTWIAGVNALGNGADGAAPGGPPLSAPAITAARRGLGYGGGPLDPAQLSVCFPGYPARDPGESDSAHRYRARRDAAHVDGLMRREPGRRRFLGERHAFLVGLPLFGGAVGASPFVVWEGSHEVMRQALGAALGDAPPERWGDIDLTDAYQAARRTCFETCRRVLLYGRPGESYLVHRLALHGVAPWTAGPKASEARAVAYFRPEFAGGAASGVWLTAP